MENSAHKIVQLNPNYHASMSNKLLNSCYSLTTIEKRIILLTLSRLNSSKEISSTEWYSMDINEYARLCNVSRSDAYDDLREATSKLYFRSITEIEGKKRTDFRWIQAIEVDVDSQSVKLMWSTNILPYISELKSDFTRLFMLDVFKIDGIYASRLYDLLYQEKFRGLVGSKEIDLETLYNSWNLPDSYREYKEFRRGVLKPAMVELTKKGLVKLDIKELVIGKKNGRKAISIIIPYQIISEVLVEAENAKDIVIAQLKKEVTQLKKYGVVLEE